VLAVAVFGGVGGGGDCDVCDTGNVFTLERNWSCVPSVSCSLFHDAAATLVHAFVAYRLNQCSSVSVGLPRTLTARLDRVLRSAARLIEVSINTLLSRVICMTHCIGFQFNSASFTEYICVGVALSP